MGWAERWGPLIRRAPGKTERAASHLDSRGFGRRSGGSRADSAEIRALLPEYELLFSVITPAGMEMAVQQAQPYVDHLFFFPFDLPWVAKRVVSRIKPRVFVSLESELWPNVLHELKKQGAKTVMVNGRISEKSFQRSKKVASGLFRWMLSNMDRLLMQSEADAERIRILGAGLQEAGRVQVLGNSKFDQEIARLSPDETIALRRNLKFPDGSPIFVAGSTRSPEEEAQVIAAYQTMRETIPELGLLMAPRQINRAEEIVEAMRAAGLEPYRRTRLPEEGAVRHLILDTMGELANVYAVAVFAFVGNSFAPVVKGGGQNLLQPLAHGKPVFFRADHATIRSEASLVTEAGVGFCVQTGEELAKAGIRLLRNETERGRDRAARTGIDRVAARRVQTLRRGCQRFGACKRP